MIRVLFMIAVAGFVLSVASLSAAVAIGGPDLVARGGWDLAEGRWGRNWSFGWHDGEDSMGWSPAEAGPTASRTLVWNGDDKLDLEVAADVRYVQGPGAGSVTLTGPKSVIDQVELRGHTLRYAHGRIGPHPKLTVLVKASGIRAFDLSGRNTLAIENYDQPTLRLDISGASEVSAKGQVGDVELEVSGSGDADLGELKAKGADVEISGAGKAVIAPTERVRIEISGMGDVKLLTRPPEVETDISGAGKVREAGPDEPPPPPSASSPSPKGTKL